MKLFNGNNVGVVFIILLIIFISGFVSGEDSSSETKIVRRKILKKKLDLESSKANDGKTFSVSVSTSSESKKQPQPAEQQQQQKTFTEQRRALFNRLNKPLLKNRSVDQTISKLRSRLGQALTNNSGEKKRVLKKVKKINSTTPKITVASNNKNESGSESEMIMIPVPESQRKPYQPVIMQISKSNVTSSFPSSTAKPDEMDSKVVTYKLNKMFVPLGIYGKVVQNKTELTPSIKHKGTTSSSERKDKSIADEVDLTYNYKVDVGKIDMTTQRVDPANVDLTMISADDDGNRRWNNNGGGNSYSVGGSGMLPPEPLPQQQQNKNQNNQQSLINKFRQSASSIPTLFHKGITTLQSLTSAYNHSPFRDDFGGSVKDSSSSASSHQEQNNKIKTSGIVASVPGGSIEDNRNKKNQGENENLEYFRNRPYLSGRSVFHQSRAVGGFHPATAPSRIAEEYYASASTQQQLKQNPTQPTTKNNNKQLNPMQPITEESNYGMFPKNYGTSPPLPSLSWRNFFGFGPEVERGLPTTTSTFSNPSTLLGGRRRSSGGSIVDEKWQELTQKYSKKDLENAREKLYHMAERNDFRGSGGGIVRELMGVFELVFNVGRGRSLEPVKNFQHIGHSKEAKDGVERISSSSEWRPVSEKSGRPLISFSAGVSFPTNNKNKQQNKQQKLNGLSSHYSASKTPFIPQKFNSLSNHINEAASTLSQSEVIYKPREKLEEETVEELATEESNDSPYELVPSDVFFSEKNGNKGEIAAVIKPVGVSDEDLRRRIPGGIVGGVPVVEYKSKPSLHQLQKYLTSSSNSKTEKKLSPLLKQNSERAQSYKKKEQSFVLPQRFYDEQKQINRVQNLEEDFNSEDFEIVRGPVDYNDDYNPQQQRKITQQQNSSPIDAELAELIKKELEKDQIPFEFVNGQSQSFIKTVATSAPEAERRVDKIQQQILYNDNNNRRNSQQYYNQNSYNKQQMQHQQLVQRPVQQHNKRPVTKFFAPIPINHSLVSQTLKGRYNSPVPRYVVELAKKLQKDRDVQGIVRVSTRRGYGPPIEYLYPVRG